MTSVLQTVYIHKLPQLADEYNNTTDTKKNIKLSDVELDTYINSDVEFNTENLKFKVSNHIRFSKHEKIL